MSLGNLEKLRASSPEALIQKIIEDSALAYCPQLTGLKRDISFGGIAVERTTPRGGTLGPTLAGITYWGTIRARWPHSLPPFESEYSPYIRIHDRTAVPLKTYEGDRRRFRVYHLDESGCAVTGITSLGNFIIQSLPNPVTLTRTLSSEEVSIRRLLQENSLLAKTNDFVSLSLV